MPTTKLGYLKPLDMRTPYLTSHHNLMINKASITVKFIATQQLLSTTWQFLHCQAGNILTEARVTSGCALSSSIAYAEA